MAMDLESRGSLKADINVTPLVDVMLVLLIIMMLIAPLLPQGTRVTLPEAHNSGEKPDTQEQIVVAIDSRSNFYVNAMPATREDLVPRVQKALVDRKDKLVYLRGDKDAKYSAIMEAMDAQRQAHIDNIGLITAPKQDQRGKTAGGGR
jgi:biopolymer transport protein TolR